MKSQLTLLEKKSILKIEDKQIMNLQKRNVIQLEKKQNYLGNQFSYKINKEKN